MDYDEVVPSGDLHHCRGGIATARNKAGRSDRLDEISIADSEPDCGADVLNYSSHFGCPFLGLVGLVKPLGGWCLVYPPGHQQTRCFLHPNPARGWGGGP